MPDIRKTAKKGSENEPFLSSLFLHNTQEETMYLMIDNYDSFTYNLADLVAETGRDVRVYRCDQISPAEIATLKPQGLIISPGPKRPEDAVHSLSIVRAFCHTLPILGVCLGMQLRLKGYRINLTAMLRSRPHCKI